MAQNTVYWLKSLQPYKPDVDLELAVLYIMKYPHQPPPLSETALIFKYSICLSRLIIPHPILFTMSEHRWKAHSVSFCF